MKIGITGIIGSGKSTFARMLAAFLRYGYYDIDTVVKAIIAENEDKFRGICRMYGMHPTEGDVLCYIHNRYFESIVLKQNIDEAIMPLLRQYIVSIPQNSVIEYALLFECNLQAHCDKTICVWTDSESRHNRLRDTRKLSTHQIERFKQHQTPESSYRDRCDYSVENKESVIKLLRKAQQIYEQIRTGN